jgi:hypothetical protein
MTSALTPTFWYTHIGGRQQERDVNEQVGKPSDGRD